MWNQVTDNKKESGLSLEHQVPTISSSVWKPAQLSQNWILLQWRTYNASTTPVENRFSPLTSIVTVTRTFSMLSVSCTSTTPTGKSIMLKNADRNKDVIYAGLIYFLHFENPEYGSKVAFSEYPNYTEIFSISRDDITLQWWHPSEKRAKMLAWGAGETCNCLSLKLPVHPGYSYQGP